jgi:hypothetical protein
MDEELDTVSSGPRWGHGAWWPGPGRSGWITILVLGGVLACLGLTISLALQVAHQNDTINKLHAAVRNARQPASAAATLPPIKASDAYTLPDTADGLYSVVAVGVRPKPGSAVLTWLFVYARHAHPGGRYGLLQATCKGQHVTTSDLADGPRTRTATLIIVAPNLAISSREVHGSRCTGGRTARRWAEYLRSHHPVLVDAGFADLQTPIPCRDGRTLKFRFPPR